jgi:uncharacterized protein (AIM24 family)
MADPIPRGPFDQGLFLTHYNKGRELFEARRFDEAERQLEEAYLLRPRDPRVLNLLGLVYYRGDKLAKAEEIYRKLIAESPEAHTLHYNLGLVCFKLGRLDDAEAAFVKALELTPGNPKLHFYLGSIYERQQRYKDAIYQYRHAGAHILVQRLEGRIGAAARPSAPAPVSASDHDADATTPPHGVTPPLGLTPPPLPPSTRVTHAAVPVEHEPGPDTKPPDTKMSAASRAAAAAAADAGSQIQPPKTVEPVSPSLMAGDQSSLRTTRRFQGYDADTTPPTARGNAALQAASTQAVKTIPPVGRTGPPDRPRDSFRALEKGLMEIEFSGKIYIKQGTIYSYSGNLTFWVKDKRPGARPSLVIVTGTGRLILTEPERDLTFMQVAEDPVFVEPAHLLACEEALQPRYVRVGKEADGLEMVALEGRGMIALSVASKPLPLTVKPGVPVSVPAPSVIMWTGDLAPHVVDDPEVLEIVMARSGGSARMVRLEGTGSILVEQAAG